MIGGTKMKKELFGLMIAVFLYPAFLCTGASFAADYPNRPITIILQTTAGTADTMVRVLAKIAEKDLGQSFVIETMPGAAGTIAVRRALRSKPDGYTVGFFAMSNFVGSPHVQKLDYDVRSDVLDVMAYCKVRLGLAVRVEAPYNTFEELLAWAKKNPGKFTYATSGIGMACHTTMERIAMKEGIKWTMVPFKSGGEAVLNCVGGHTECATEGPLSVVPYIKSGKLKLLLILDGSHWPGFPNVPAITEKGYNFTAASYHGFFLPKGSPEGIRQKLEDVFKKAMQDPSFQEFENKLGVQLQFMGGKEFGAMWRSKYDEMGEVMKALGLSYK
jgi:tripartite-type tricarboxylate transporter receptor subunit TctC